MSTVIYSSCGWWNCLSQIHGWAEMSRRNQSGRFHVSLMLPVWCVTVIGNEMCIDWRLFFFVCFYKCKWLWQDKKEWFQSCAPFLISPFGTKKRERKKNPSLLIKRAQGSLGFAEQHLSWKPRNTKCVGCWLCLHAASVSLAQPPPVGSTTFWINASIHRDCWEVSLSDETISESLTLRNELTPEL